MIVGVEHISSVVRVWVSSSAKYGDQYDWCVTARWLNRHEVEFINMMSAPAKEMWNPIKYAFHDLGVKTIHYVRYKDGRRIEKRTNTKPRPAGLLDESAHSYGPAAECPDRRQAG